VCARGGKSFETANTERSGGSKTINPHNRIPQETKVTRFSGAHKSNQGCGSVAEEGRKINRRRGGFTFFSLVSFFINFISPTPSRY
jgi:hypothetical protein